MKAQTINERIEFVLERSGKTKTAFGKSLNVSQQYISKLVKTGNPSELLIDDICEKYHIRKEWLLHGTGDPDQPLDRQDEIAKLTTELFRGEENSFKERLILTLSRLNESEWEVLEKIAEEITKEKD